MPDTTHDQCVPDIMCHSPDGLTTYIIDVCITWKLRRNYEETRSSVADGGKEKARFVASGAPTEPLARAHMMPVARFVPFSVEISGAWGPARALGASTSWRWLTLTMRSTSNTFTGATHASQPFGGKPSQSVRPASKIGLAARKGD
jgi:hypothetical protein